MAKVKYDVTGVEDASDWVQAPVGLYRAQIAETNVGQSNSGQPMLTIVFELTHDGKGKKLKERYGRVWHRVPLEHWEDTAGWTFRLKEFIKALGLKEKGSFDPDKLEGDKMQVKLRAGKDLDDNYRPEVSKLMALASDDDADEEEPDEEEEDEQDEDEEEESDAPSVEDLEAMSLSELKDQVEEQEVEVEGKATKKKLVAALTEHFWGEDEEEDEDEEDEDTEDEEDTEEEEDDDDEAEDYSDWSRNALIKEARSRDMKVTKAMSEDDIREALVESDGADDEEEEDEDEEEEEQDYSDWSVKDLKAELKERGLKTTGSQSQLVKRLESDDESEEDPF